MKKLHEILSNDDTTIVPKRFREIALVQKLWVDIVGPKFNAYTLPLKVIDKTLVVGIAQSVWSNEIQFHKNKILTELASHNIHLKHIKTVTHQIMHSTSPTVSEENDSHPISPSENLASSLSQTMLAQEQLKNRRIRAGWTSCTNCERLHPGPLKHCQDCIRDKREKLTQKVYQHLTREPWTSNQQLQKICPQLPLEWFEKIRQKLYGSLHQRIYQGYWELKQEKPLPKDYRSLILQATMLICQQPPHQLDKGHFKRSLRGLRFVLDDYLVDQVSKRPPRE